MLCKDDKTLSFCIVLRGGVIRSRGKNLLLKKRDRKIIFGTRVSLRSCYRPQITFLPLYYDKPDDWIKRR